MRDTNIKNWSWNSGERQYKIVIKNVPSYVSRIKKTSVGFMLFADYKILKYLRAYVYR